MSSDDPTEYSDSSEESESPPSEPVPEQPKATLSTYMTTFGHLVPLYIRAMDVWMYLLGDALQFWTFTKANNPEANDWYYFTASLAEQFREESDIRMWNIRASYF